MRGQEEKNRNWERREKQEESVRWRKEKGINKERQQERDEKKEESEKWSEEKRV